VAGHVQDFAAAFLIKPRDIAEQRCAVDDLPPLLRQLREHGSFARRYGNPATASLALETKLRWASTANAAEMRFVSVH
jgi:hypothetical protein